MFIFLALEYLVCYTSVSVAGISKLCVRFSLSRQYEVKNAIEHHSVIVLMLKFASYMYCPIFLNLRNKCD